MHCYVYKGDKKDDHYLYLDYEFSADKLAEGFPMAILSMMGDLSLIVEFELDAGRKLPQADAEHVMSDIASQGFYLQMPKKDMLAEENVYFN